MPDTLIDTVHRVEAALKPRLRGVLHEAAFAVSLVTGTVIVCLAHGTRAIVAVCHAVARRAGLTSASSPKQLHALQ